MNSETDNGSVADKTDESAVSLTKKQRVLLSVRTMGKVILNFILDGFAPVAAAAALIFAVIAYNANQSSQAQDSKVKAKMEALNTNLLANKSELAKLRADLALQVNKVAERNKIQDEQKLLLIQSVSKLQKKLKISPTMEEKMLETENRAAVQPLDKPISVTKVAPVATVPTKSKVTASSDKKSLDRTDVLKDAINKFNKN